MLPGDKFSSPSHRPSGSEAIGITSHDEWLSAFANPALWTSLYPGKTPPFVDTESFGFEQPVVRKSAWNLLQLLVQLLSLFYPFPSCGLQVLFDGFLRVTRFVTSGFPHHSGCNQICRLFFDMRNVMIFGENFLVDIHSFFLDCDPSKVDDTLEQ